MPSENENAAPRDIREINKREKISDSKNISIIITRSKLTNGKKTESIWFTVPEKKTILSLYVISDSYLGLDQMYQFRIDPLDPES